MQKVELTEKTKPLNLAKIKDAQQHFLDWHATQPYIRYKFSTDGRIVTFYEDRDVTTFCMTFTGKFKVLEK